MADDLEQVQAYIGALLAGLAPAERRKILRAAGVEWRRSHQRRIRAQQNVDGSPFAPRARQEQRLRNQAGAIKRRAAAKPRRMFEKLAQAKHLKLEVTDREVSIGFAQNATSRIARVHHEGLRDRVTRRPGSPVVQYPRRELVGMSEGDQAMILDRILEQLRARA